MTTARRLDHGRSVHSLRDERRGRVRVPPGHARPGCLLEGRKCPPQPSNHHATTCGAFRSLGPEEPLNLAKLVGAHAAEQRRPATRDERRGVGDLPVIRSVRRELPIQQSHP